MQLYFLNYNTYGNRIVKKEESISDYLQYEVARETNANFNINDGVNTKLPVNSSNAGNYLLVVNNDVIHSRWFVMESKYTRNGQHFLSLRRDLMVDYYDDIITAPCFIEKATVNAGDPAIFNNENMTFNQIKESETSLKDETGSSWLVGYFATKNASSEVMTYQTQAIFNTTNINPDIIVAGIENWEYNTYITNYYLGYSFFPLKYYTSIEAMRIGASAFTNIEPLWYSSNKNGQVYNRETGATDPAAYSVQKEQNEYYSTVSQNLQQYYADAVKNNATLLEQYGNTFMDVHTNNETIELEKLNNKIIQDTTTNKYYKIEITSVNNLVEKYVEIGSNLYNAFQTMLNDLVVDDKIFKTAYYDNENRYKVTYYGLTYKIQLEELNNYTANVNIGTTRYHLVDAPYDLFCMPYSDNIGIYDNGTLKYTSNKDMAFQVFMELARKYGGESAKSLYDIQLLPYCPVRYLIQDNKIDVRGDTKAISYITNGNDEVIGGILFAQTSSFTLNINNEIEITDTKVECLTDKYRLCSPNYNGVFEFNAAKNGGVDFYNVDCTYKPYNPYIHVNPNFKELYGNDFNDSRGLIVGGDFSLPQTTSAWESYQLSNKNFQASFDRQILNMEVNNSINNVKSAVSAAGGVIGVAAMGGIAAGIGSLIAGAADVGLNLAQQQETIDFSKDLFGYNLGNIQALPTGLSKTSAITYNNKIFPFVEKYSCTETEKNALRNKIKYNGMTVMRIGNIVDFMQLEKTYIKGQIIRLQIKEDNHLLESIREEVNKGVYI